MNTLEQKPLHELVREKSSQWPLRLAAAGVALLCGAFVSQAAIVAPYQPDSATLHLWHLDEAASPCVDSAAGGTNLTALAGGATLNNASFTGFGTALSTADGGQAATVAGGKDASLSCLTLVNGAGDNVAITYADPTTGAFTMEAVVRVDFNPALNYGTVATGGNGRNSLMIIVSGEDEANPGRIFQFRIAPINTSSANTTVNLEFLNVHQAVSVQTVAAPIPTTGPDAIVSNGWYHVAVTYNGSELTADNVKLYWTAMDGTRTSASEIWSTLMQFDLSSGATDFAVGQTGRNGAGNNFVGLIDEVRLSKIARAANAMMFADNTITINTQPADTKVAVGNPVSLSVAAVGQAPLRYQWQLNGTNVPNASNDSYSISAAQFSDAGPYRVIITNNFTIATSTVATLTVRTPLNLTWLGTSGGDWDETTVNWDTNSDLAADTAYTTGDNTLFNDSASAFNVNLTQAFRPNSVTINSSQDYTFSTTSGGSISGITGLSKSGAGRLTLDTDNTYSGGSVLQGGVVTLGTGGAHGSLGSGVVTNNSGLVINRSGNVAFASGLHGSGGLTNQLTASVSITGTNTLSGPVVLNGGNLSLVGAQAKGNAPSYTLNASAQSAGTTTLTLSGGFNFSAGAPFSLLGSIATPDTRATMTFSDSTNVINGPVTLGGDGVLQMFAGAGSSVVFNSPINSPGFVGKLILRGSGGSGVITGPITIGGHVSVTDSAIWLIGASGNTWTNSDVAGGVMRMGAINAFPATAQANVNSGNLDLAGYDQTVGGLYSYNTTTFALLGTGVIASSSTNNDSILTVNNSQAATYAGIIRDSISNGTRRVGLRLTGGGALTLTNISTYSGPTTVNNATLYLANSGSISNSSVVSIASAATLDAAGRTDGTFTISGAQTLTGNGAFSVVGNLTNKGTIELKLSKSGAVLTNDSINGLSQITYGGTLKLDVTASPSLTVADSFKLFNASGYAAAFATFIPANPGSGLAWDTSTLTSDGTLRIAVGPNTTPTNITAVVSGGGTQLDLTWPADHKGWTLQAQTNSAGTGLGTNWVNVANSDTTNHIVIPINKANGSAFFRLKYP